MDEKKDCGGEVTKIHEDNMEFVVINYYNKEKQKSNESKREEIENHLYKVFEKYI